MTNLPNTDPLTPENRDPVFHPGERVQTIYGAARAGTVVEFHQGRPDSDGRRPYGYADVRWDDTRNEVCTGVTAGNLASSSIIDALAELVRQPAPTQLARRGLVVMLDDLGCHAPPMLARDAALRLGAAFLAGAEDLGPWW